MLQKIDYLFKNANVYTRKAMEMHNLYGINNNHVAQGFGAMLIAFSLSIASMSGAKADEDQAKELLKAMSDYLASQNDISFEYDSSLEVVTSENQKIGFASSGKVEVSRPDKIRASRKGGFSNVEMTYDGKTLSILGKDANLYAQAEVRGDIDHLVEELRSTYKRPIPAADLLTADFYGQIMPLVIDVKDLGSGVIGGVECDHIAMRTEDVDFQIWITQGDEPYPCRYEITSAKVTGSPQYTIDVRAWRTGGKIADSVFNFEAPSSATKIGHGELPGLDELPDEYQPEGAK